MSTGLYMLPHPDASATDPAQRPDDTQHRELLWLPSTAITPWAWCADFPSGIFLVAYSSQASVYATEYTIGAGLRASAQDDAQDVCNDHGIEVEVKVKEEVRDESQDQAWSAQWPSYQCWSIWPSQGVGDQVLWMARTTEEISTMTYWVLSLHGHRPRVVG